MTNHDQFNSDGNGQFVLSYELLYLLQWLIDNESETLKKMINRAIKQGFKEQRMQSNDIVEVQISDNIQQSIVDFLGLLDTLLMESTNENSVQKVLQSNQIPALNHIDSSVCDNETVQGSLDKTTSKLKGHPEQNAQEILLKELLKRWKPQKKNVAN